MTLDKILPERVLEDIAVIRSARLEWMCAAFLEETGCLPSEAVLCEKTDGTEIRWWIEKKPIPKPIIRPDEVDGADVPLVSNSQSFTVPFGW